MTRVSRRVGAVRWVGLLVGLVSNPLWAGPDGPAEVATFGPAVVNARSAAVLMSGQEGGELPMSLLALADSSCGAESSSVTVWVEVAGDRLVELAGASGGELAIVAYVLDGAGAVVDREARRLWIEPDRHSAPLLDRGLKVALRMRQAAGGESEVRVLAQWPGGPFGVRVRHLPAAEAGSSPPSRAAGWPPLIPEPTDHWAINRQPAPGGQDVPRIAGWLDSWVPAARPVLSGPREAYLAVPGSPEEVQWVVRFAPRAGGQPIDVAAETLGTEVRPRDSRAERVMEGCVWLAVRLDPSPLPAGAYRLTAREEGSDRPDAAPFVEALVGNASSEAFESGESRPAPEDSTAEDLVGRSDNGLRGEYLGALLQAARADPRHQGEELASFEVKALAALGSVVHLERLQARALGALSGDESTTALAAALLHAGAARAHQRHQRIGLVRYSLRRALQLLDGAKADREEVAQALGSLGSWALRRGYAMEARDLLGRAVELAPGQGDSQLLLAAWEEKSGQHRSVVKRLEPLMQLEGFAGIAEARLRLAVNLVRVGRSHEAARWFEQIASGPGATWIRQLAAQEQVRLLRRTDPARAEQRAREALDSWPGEPEFLLLVSQLLESRGRYRSAREVLEPLDERSYRSRSPRAQYEQWPDLGHSNLGAEVRQAADRQRSVLIERLAREAGE